MDGISLNWDFREKARVKREFEAGEKLRKALKNYIPPNEWEALEGARPEDIQSYFTGRGQPMTLQQFERTMGEKVGVPARGRAGPFTPQLPETRLESMRRKGLEIGPMSLAGGMEVRSRYPTVAEAESLAIQKRGLARETQTTAIKLKLAQQEFNLAERKVNELIKSNANEYEINLAKLELEKKRQTYLEASLELDLIKLGAQLTPERRILGILKRPPTLQQVKETLKALGGMGMESEGVETLEKPANVDQKDWNTATDEQKRALINALKGIK